MIVTRSYMCIEPIELWLDIRSLRRGLVYPVDPDADPTALLVQDSGMVPVNTQIAIVNPETCTLSHVGEYGEIWVQSDACATGFYRSKNEFDAERLNGRVADGDPGVPYVRTGDLGFLHTVTRPIGPGGQDVEMQVLFVLGSIGETFEVNGLNHFPMDIENSVEACHRNIVNGGSAIFQAGGLIVVVVEVTRKAFLASLVPVIVDVILNEHQVVADIVAFVSHGDFPRSRLGEKQRGKVLASWVTRKLRTIAQFSIRDLDENIFAELPQHRASRSSKPGSTMGTSTRRGSTMNPENDFSSVPRSPAGVVLEETIAPQASYHEGHPQHMLPELDTRTDRTVSATPVPEPTSAVPYIEEPQSATIMSADDDHHYNALEHDQNAGAQGESRDFRFSFDMVSTPVDQPGGERPSTGRDSLPSQQPGLYNGGGNVAGPMHDSMYRPGTQESGVIDDWPQEALMYQNSVGGDEEHDFVRRPSAQSAAVRHRYDGTGYE